MGQIWSRVRKKPSTIEVLEEFEKEIERLEEYRRSTAQQQKKLIGALIFYSVILYILGAIFAFFRWSPSDVKGQIISIVPLVIFPFVIWLFKRLCHWYFRRRLELNSDSLTELLRKRRTTLNEVKEKETYKKAKEILEKFDPEYKKKKQEEEEAAAAAAAQKSLASTASDLRRRQLSARGGLRGRGRGNSPPPSSALVVSQPNPGVTLSMNGQQWPRPPGPPMPRPILPREPKVMDRLIDFMVGDGPSNRYALICQRCCSHNGMALKEEFEYIAFRCCYCYFLNPARKVRPYAPRLPSTPLPAISLPTQNEDSQDSVTESDSEVPKDGIHEKKGENLNEQTVEISEVKDESEPEGESPAVVPAAPEDTSASELIVETQLETAENLAS